MKKHVFLFISMLNFSFFLIKAQDEILMTIGDRKITRSEFERIYHKNNSSTTYENKSPKEYLDLFINFKLKVIEAENNGYDTMSKFTTELAGYRDQLAKPYLQDKGQIEVLLNEAYRRTITEVNASHIALKVPAGATPADTAEIYNKIMNIRNRILAGESFEDMAVAYSDDRNAIYNKGNIGWFSAFRMVYPFEEAAYTTPVGQISMPFRTRFGYHIIRTNAFRPAIGEVLLSHIMVKASRDDDSATHAAARAKINDYYNRLLNGESFFDVATKYSEDYSSARVGGKLRWIRSGELLPELEDKIFAITDSGKFTEPVQSDHGYHIFMIHGRRPIKSFDEMKAELEDRLNRDERRNFTEKLYVDKLKKDYGFTEYPENYSELMNLVDSSLYDNKWDPFYAGPLIDPLFTIGNREYTQADLANYLRSTKKYSVKESLELIVKRKYDDFVKEKVLEYEKDMLDDKYPEFRYLMEEYHDGILLFNIMDDMVWSKAVKDTAGLENFFKKNRKNYNWQTRADVTIFTVKDSSLTEKILSLAPDRFSKGISDKDFNIAICGNDSIQCVDIKNKKYEKGDDKNVDNMNWMQGSSYVYREKNKIVILYINDILKPQPKKFNEARGLVTADYQNYLEKQWIKQLRKKYPVVIDKKVLATIK